MASCADPSDAFGFLPVPLQGTQTFRCPRALMAPTPRQRGHASSSACASLDGATVRFPKVMSFSLEAGEIGSLARSGLDSGLAYTVPRRAAQSFCGCGRAIARGAPRPRVKVQCTVRGKVSAYRSPAEQDGGGAHRGARQRDFRRELERFGEMKTDECSRHADQRAGHHARL